MINATTDVIKGRWKVSEKDVATYGSGASVEYLSVDIRALPQGFFLSQPAYTVDMLERWSTSECRPIGSLDEVVEGSDSEDGDEDEAEGDSPALQRVRKAQRLAGGLNWLATRTRPTLHTT